MQFVDSYCNILDQDLYENRKTDLDVSQVVIDIYGDNVIIKNENGIWCYQ